MSDEGRMRSHRAAQEAAAAVHARVRSMQKMYGRDVVYGVVRVSDPLSVELIDEPTVLVEGDELRLTNMLRWWRENYEIAEGDVLVLAPMENDEFVAFDLRSIAKVSAGLRPVSATSGTLTITATDSHGDTVAVNIPVARKLELYNASGVLIGEVPVFAPGVLP